MLDEVRSELFLIGRGRIPGVFFGLFDVLSHPKSDVQRASSQYNAWMPRIPETIYYNFCRPQCWYTSLPVKCSSKTEAWQLCKNRKEELTCQAITNHFCNTRIARSGGSSKKYGVAARLIANSISGEHSTPNKSSFRSKNAISRHLHIEYLSAEELTYRLQRAAVATSTLVQVFVEPKQCDETHRIHCTIIKCHWQPHFSYVELYRNCHALADRTLALQDRCTTVETSDNVIVERVRSATLRKQLQLLSNAIAEHVDMILSAKLWSIDIYCVLGFDSQLYLLWCQDVVATCVQNPIDEISCHVSSKPPSALILKASLSSKNCQQVQEDYGSHSTSCSSRYRTANVTLKPPAASVNPLSIECPKENSLKKDKRHRPEYCTKSVEISSRSSSLYQGTLYRPWHRDRCRRTDSRTGTKQTLHMRNCSKPILHDQRLHRSNRTDLEITSTDEGRLCALYEWYPGSIAPRSRWTLCDPVLLSCGVLRPRNRGRLLIPDTSEKKTDFSMQHGLPSPIDVPTPLCLTSQLGNQLAPLGKKCPDPLNLSISSLERNSPRGEKPHAKPVCNQGSQPIQNEDCTEKRNTDQTMETRGDHPYQFDDVNWGTSHVVARRALLHSR